MTWRELVRKYFPEADDEKCDYILWELTSFPCGDAEDVEQQLIHIKNVGIENAMEEKEEELESVSSESDDE